MSRERTRELINVTVEKTENSFGYSYHEEVREIPIPGFEDKLKRSVFILEIEDEEKPLEFITIRGLKKTVTQLLRDWRLEHGIMVSILTAASPELVQRKLVKAHAGMLRTLAQASEARLTAKLIKRIEKTLESMTHALDLIEEQTGVSNESIVSAMEAHKAKLRDSRKVKDIS